MHKNTEGLKRSARLRSEDVMHRALVALSRMEGSNREINFRNSRRRSAGLHGMAIPTTGNSWPNHAIAKMQTWSPSAGSDKDCRECLSRKNGVATLRMRIKKLEEKNRELIELLEHAYGVIAETSEGAADKISG
jgi:hypothetical protein